jgi:hypothetical protein
MMGFVLVMLMAFILAVTAMSVLGFFALRESKMMSVFHDGRQEQR